MELFDTHLHLTDTRLWTSIESELDQCRSHGITGFLNAGFNQDEWKRQRKLQELWEGALICSWGLHPFWVNQNLNNLSRLESEFSFLKENPSSYQSIGETGLDFRSAFKSSEEVQIKYFKKHIDLFFELDKPLVLHLVRSSSSAIQILKKYKKKFRGIVHSFSGSPEEANELVKLGFHISFSGSVTARNNKRIRKSAISIPSDSLMIETDSPDQKPETFEEDLNHPWSLQILADELGHIRSCTGKDIIKYSNSNFKQLFQI